MTTKDILTLRLHNEQLTATKFKTPSEIVGWLGAVQSQDFPGAKWALSQRLHFISDEIVEEAFGKGEILRTHVMRPTWHFVHPTDIRWMLSLTGPRVSKMMATYNKLLELNDEVFKTAQEKFIKILKGNKFLSRQELKTELTRIGIKTNVQRLAHIVMQAELDAVICSGPRIGKQFTYALLEERVPKTTSLNPDQALVELTKRYFQSHGPATIKDFVWWSGLTTTDVRRGIDMISPKLSQETIEGKEYWFFQSDPRPISPDVYLLPNYDEYAIAYKDRDAFFNQAYSDLLDTRGNTIFQHMIVHHGQIIGLWKRTLKKDRVVIEHTFFEKPTEEVMNEFKKAVERYGNFLGLDVVLS